MNENNGGFFRANRGYPLDVVVLRRPHVPNQNLGTRRDVWEQNGTITFSTGVYRAFRSDQGLVNLAFTLRRQKWHGRGRWFDPTRSTIFSTTYELADQVVGSNW
jgi:hypothetical protein